MLDPSEIDRTFRKALWGLFIIVIGLIALAVFVGLAAADEPVVVLVDLEGATPAVEQLDSSGLPEDAHEIGFGDRLRGGLANSSKRPRPTRRPGVIVRISWRLFQAVVILTAGFAIFVLTIVWLYQRVRPKSTQVIAEAGDIVRAIRDELRGGDG